MSVTNMTPGDTTTRGEKVGEFCPIDAGTQQAEPGHWRCNTHDEDFPNNFSMDTHVSHPGSHEQVWICHTHGRPEA